MLKIKHKRTKPYTPRTNGKAERFVQTSSAEFSHIAARAGAKVTVLQRAECTYTWELCYRHISRLTETSSRCTRWIDAKRRRKWPSSKTNHTSRPFAI